MDPFDSRDHTRLLDNSQHWLRNFKKQYQIYMDIITPYLAARWAFLVLVLLFFMLRVIIGSGWYVICYGLGIYYLNLVIDFVTPRIDPASRDAVNDLERDVDFDSGPALPTKVNDEFRPFIRRLPEFKFWVQGTRATLIALFLSMFDVFDIPVFWPILFLYFIILTGLTMRRHMKHMKKYNYVPWNTGKTRYDQG